MLLTALHCSTLLPCRCIECGFCESNCPSRDVTLTPRQRITVHREMARLRSMPSRTSAEEERLQAISTSYDYDGEATCAADGMCQEKCPVKINTGARHRLLGCWADEHVGATCRLVVTRVRSCVAVVRAGR